MRVSYILCTVLLMSCHDSKNVILESHQLEVRSQVLESDIAFIHPFVYEEMNNAYIPFLSQKSKSVELLNIQTGKVDYVISLLSLDTMKRYPEDEDINTNLQWGCSFYFHNTDSIFVRMEVLPNTLFLIRNNGEIEQKWQISPQTEPPVIMEFFNLMQSTYYKGKIFVASVPKINDTEMMEYRQKYFSHPSDLIIDIKQEPITYRFFGKWPENYLKKNYYDTYPERCIGYDEQVVYSFAADHNLYVFSSIYDSLPRKINGKSSYINDFIPFNDDSMGNIGYIKKYYTTTPRYKTLMFDKYRKCYYRIAAHSLPFINNNGLLNTSADKPWSLMIFDSTLTLRKEILFDPGKHLYYSFMIIKKGILIKQNSEGDDTLFHLKWTLFEVKL